MSPKSAQLKTTTRLLLNDEIALGPGKADLLQAIVELGSISAAGKHLRMSYRRAWQLVDVMNRCFSQPLVNTAKGGSQGGGAQLTELGREVLAEYRALQVEMAVLLAAREVQWRSYLKTD